MKHLKLNLDLTGVIIILAAGVLLPILLSTAVGIVAITLAQDTGSIVTGVLVISFTVTAAGFGLLALVFTGRKAHLALQQADFIANVSHELRTPLSAIRLYAQTLQSGKLDDDPDQTAQCIATILRETAWLEAMIERVLTWRIASKDLLKLELETKPVSEAVNGAVHRFLSMVESEGLSLSFSIETRLCVEHDEKVLNAVVLNLLTNAYKYTGADKRIEVRVVDREHAVQIEVEDNGIGIGPADRKRIFQPFYRVRQQKAGGAGLGLAIARHLVWQHGGRIDITSRKREGTCFCITLPAKEGNE